MLLDRTTVGAPTRAARPRHRVLRWVLALFCVVAVSAGVVLVVAGLQPHPPPPAPSAQHPFALSPAQAQAQAGDPGSGSAAGSAGTSKPHRPTLPSVLVPNHLYIPSLGVNAPLDPESITKEGDFVVPPNVARATARCTNCPRSNPAPWS